MQGRYGQTQPQTQNQTPRPSPNPNLVHNSPQVGFPLVQNNLQQALQPQIAPQQAPVVPPQPSPVVPNHPPSVTVSSPVIPSQPPSVVASQSAVSLPQPVPKRLPKRRKQKQGKAESAPQQVEPTNLVDSQVWEPTPTKKQKHRMKFPGTKKNAKSTQSPKNLKIKNTKKKFIFDPLNDDGSKDKKKKEEKWTQKEQIL